MYRETPLNWTLSLYQNTVYTHVPNMSCGPKFTYVYITNAVNSDLFFLIPQGLVERRFTKLVKGTYWNMILITHLTEHQNKLMVSSIVQVCSPLIY